MKYAAIILASFVLFLIACAPAQPTAPAEPAAEPKEVVVTPEPAAPPAVVQPGPTPVEAKPEPAVSKELQALLSRADQKLKSYQYLELVIPDKQQPDTIAVRGSRIKITLYEYEPYVPAEYFDTVYLETSTKTAVGRCENQKRCIWHRGDNTNREWKLDYDKYRRKTPYEWLKGAPAAATIIGPEVHENRATTKIQYDDAGKFVTMWIDDTYGIPVEIWIITSSNEKTTYKFNDLQFNTILDRDVTPAAI